MAYKKVQIKEYEQRAQNRYFNIKDRRGVDFTVVVASVHVGELSAVLNGHTAAIVCVV